MKVNYVNCQQTHSSNVHIVKKKDVGKTIPNCDGLITNLKNITLLIQTADCVPITLIDPVRKVVGVVHAGWRGSEKEIVKNAINLMINEFESDKKDIKIKIGPAIDKDNFIVRNDVKNKFKDYEDYFEKISEDQWKFDLVGVNIKQMLSLGILEENIENSKISTYLNKNYPSYRRDGITKGFETKIMLK
ncbi:MAG: peptidoglycan editing factor PgeF [bacterium]|nr:MAG: peptidoglycan editing factor PgeF [bacterium]